MGIAVAGLYRYPVKSCRGERLDSAVVEPWGLAGDRRWMLVDDAGKFITARECPPLVLVTPSLVTPSRTSTPTDNSNIEMFAAGKSLRLRAPGLPDLTVPVPEAAAADLVPVSVWDSHLMAARASDEAAEWFTTITGKPARLVYLDDPARRPTDPRYSRETDRVSFADGYPLLLTSEGSLAQLNDWIFEGPHPAEGPLPMTRFRPSVVIRGAAPWAEDEWREVRIGGVPFRVAKACDRCVFTTIDPGTAVKGKEPLVTLARHRRWDGKTWFGVNLIPDLPGDGTLAAVNAGDPVEAVG